MRPAASSPPELLTVPRWPTLPLNLRPLVALSVLALVSAVFSPAFLLADEQERLQVGRQADGRILVPTNQILSPAGRQVVFPGRPVDLVMASALKPRLRGRILAEVAYVA